MLGRSGRRSLLRLELWLVLEMRREDLWAAVEVEVGIALRAVEAQRHVFAGLLLLASWKP
jgi:hypothetical protein